MNEELQNALSELINKSVEVGGNALAFTQDELPEVVRQLLLWKASISAIGFAVCVMAIIASFVVLSKRLKWKPEVYETDDEFIKYLAQLAKSKEFHQSYHAKELLSVIGAKPIQQQEAPDELFAVSVVLLVAGVGPIFTCFDWLQIWLAPKVYLIEYAASLVN